MAKRLEVKRGLNLPILGAPAQKVEPGPAVRKVAVLGGDYVGMKPTMAVQLDDRVKLGQVLFTDKKTPGVRYTSPASGKIVAIHRGSKRSLQSVVVEVEGDDELTFDRHLDQGVENLTRDQIRDTLVESGLWTALRTRPFSKVPAPEAVPHSIFVAATDTNPLAARPDLSIGPQLKTFQTGVLILSKLTDGPVFVCTKAGSSVRVDESERVTHVEVSGPHPAGLVGTHIHFLDPVGKGKTNWSIGYQDTIAVGKLFTTGRISTERTISLAGPMVKNPRIIETRLGASTDDLTDGELESGECRVVSGSVLAGHHALGPCAFLGRYHQQVSVLPEDRQRVLFGWLSLGWNKFSLYKVVLSGFRRLRAFRFTTSLEGARRAIVPFGMYEKVMPLDIEPTFLLRALAVRDVEQSEELGCLELDEEDLGLCTFVCTGKTEYGPLLREVLTAIERDG